MVCQNLEFFRHWFSRPMMVLCCGRNRTKVWYWAHTSGATSSLRSPEVAWPRSTAASGSSLWPSSWTSGLRSSARSAPRPALNTSSWCASLWASVEAWPSQPWTFSLPSGPRNRRDQQCPPLFMEVGLMTSYLACLLPLNLSYFLGNYFDHFWCKQYILWPYLSFQSNILRSQSLAKCS